ncbi:hypothetical protein CEXT_700961 [Caerostris extrusa]|uniref:Uncharacterized protein n=1 Tax=Caerostris extrusa TaxID=172846 RepID=A0AAV4X9H0_CAEEX|nr:hypothetical protein CEXT_700961 [Caerostris extrusa]
MGIELWSIKGDPDPQEGRENIWEKLAARRLSVCEQSDTREAAVGENPIQWSNRMNKLSRELVCHVSQQGKYTNERLFPFSLGCVQLTSRLIKSTLWSADDGFIINLNLSQNKSRPFSNLFVKLSFACHLSCHGDNDFQTFHRQSKAAMETLIVSEAHQ